jgi:hypothetical protein
MSPAHIIPTTVASDDLANDQIDFLIKMNVIAVVVIIGVLVVSVLFGI